MYDFEGSLERRREIEARTERRKRAAERKLAKRIMGVEKVCHHRQTKIVAAQQDETYYGTALDGREEERCVQCWELMGLPV